MTRRELFKSLVAGSAGPVLAAVPGPVEAPLPRIQRAEDTGFILGVATETVQAGDFVQIQTVGPVTVNIVPHRGLGYVKVGGGQVS